MASSPAINIASLKPVIEWPENALSVPEGVKKVLERAVQIELEQKQLETLGLATYSIDTNQPAIARTITPIGVLKITQQAKKDFSTSLVNTIGLGSNKADIIANDTYRIVKRAYIKAYEEQAQTNHTTESLAPVINAFAASSMSMV